MNNRIHVLDENVYARIAAGEVVVNPAAVVKELMENSIDAGATSITVEIADGGKTLIRVTDNGSGIVAEDVPLAVQKHATSKISSLSDLGSIGTLGFRGEALCSMAAVSRFSMQTRTAQSSEGTVLTASGESVPEIHAAGLPEGTTVRVENLFYNIPARQKFLKNTARETTNVTSVVTKLIFSRPDISVKYISNGKLVYHSPGSGELTDALMTVYGKEIRHKMRPVAYNEDDISISGYLSNPTFLYKSTHHICMYLNGRFIRSKDLQSALIRGYGERLLRGHYPFAVLHIHIPFAKADVNVHPNKLQVMLYEEAKAINAMERAVKSALANTQPPVLEDVGAKTAINIKSTYEPPAEDVTYPAFRPAEKLYDKPAAKAAQTVDHVLPHKYEQAKPFDKLIDEVKTFHEETHEQLEIEDVRKLCDYHIIGQAWNTFLIVESGQNLYLIDQHAAHERINFERMKREATEGTAASQTLMMPYAMSLSSEDHALLLKNEELLRALGFDFEEFGAMTLKFTAFPAQVNRSSAESLMEDILYELRNSPENILLLREQVIRASCRYSIKAGYALSDEQIAELMSEITALDAIPHCPHGRPIAIVLTKNNLQKGFKRIV
ncbi:MAG: DNA mismatch repair endonuclease MutL [Christensenella sp.]|uniref:DNA mismatch repair endonuclease MutL n=1 Tax=Christensenella sp. TaxID=1935934 RepID=UPI002B1FB56C|nr:DNA mismatch repair endonuclease MutL [Christensenella sp.]MEA5003437.1 DNA mismatch repair endonuclease MutL [Christensenella sp.]